MCTVFYSFDAVLPMNASDPFVGNVGTTVSSTGSGFVFLVYVATLALTQSDSAETRFILQGINISLIYCVCLACPS